MAVVVGEEPLEVAVDSVVVDSRLEAAEDQHTEEEDTVVVVEAMHRTRIG